MENTVDFFLATAEGLTKLTGADVDMLVNVTQFGL